MIDYAADRACKHGSIKTYYVVDGAEYECQWCEDLLMFVPPEQMTPLERARWERETDEVRHY